MEKSAYFKPQEVEQQPRIMRIQFSDVSFWDQGIPTLDYGTNHTTKSPCRGLRSFLTSAGFVPSLYSPLILPRVGPFVG